MPKSIPTIAVVEEAQAVLNERGSASEPYLAWVKEGRKYDLGALLVTQQPGSIPVEIPSQGDNWFVFHLLSSSDLGNVRSANAHFSNDLLSALLNEPIPGQGVFWSSVSGTPYRVALRVLSFEKAHPALDLAYDRPAACTLALRIREEFERELRKAGVPLAGDVVDASPHPESFQGDDGISDLDGRGGLAAAGADILGAYKRNAILALREDTHWLPRVRGEGAASEGVPRGSPTNNP